MTAREFARRFPNASQATIAINCALRTTKPDESSGTLDAHVSREDESVARPLVSFTRCGKRLLDADNLSACFKDLLDGIKFAHLITDDSPKHIDFKASQRQTLPNEEPHTLIEIYYA